MEAEENLYELIAKNIRERRKELHISQGQLAETAQLSIDTIKSVERGRRAMSLDSYIRITDALDIAPIALMNSQKSISYVERFSFMMKGCTDNQAEFVLHMVEQLLKAQAYYLMGGPAV